MFWGLSEDLINKNNYDEVNKLLDFKNYKAGKYKPL